ncbi:WD40 repeat-like protein [Rhizodiscina lignyota]|uniref:Ribosome assembly protein 4 n=1 Tax=Rhizodiscina lignyota TaxID=1504668 RepID=A0A9P4IGV5_9PEZI|nr:WD40 repeat-like protein [Rhizodiscina lignyota]
MATVPPPPSKRRKLEAELRTREQNDQPPPSGNVRVRFVDRATNEQVGSTVAIPLAQATTKNLNVLLNSLKGLDDAAERVPHRFFVRRESTAGVSTQAIADGSDLHGAVENTEEEISLEYEPQAVFRVRAVSRCSASISGHGQVILAAQFSPASSSKLVTGSGDATARIWDCETGTPVSTLKGHTKFILAVSWSPDDTMIATGSDDSTVRLWDKKGKPLGNALKGHTKSVMSLSWEPYHIQEPGRPRLASSSRDATVRIWDAVSKRCDIVLSGHKDSVTCVRWGGTGVIYTASLDRTIKIWSASTGILEHTLSSHAARVNHLALSTDFALRTAFHDHTREVPATTEEKIAKAKEQFKNAATFNGEVTERLVSASDDLTMFLWEPSKSKKPLARLQGHQKPVNHVTFSPDGLYIASASFDNHVKLWSARDGKFISTLRGHVSDVYQCCFSPDSRLLVSASKDTTLKVWDVAKGTLKEDLPGHQDEVYAVDWSPDGERVGSGGKDRAVRLWRH